MSFGDHVPWIIGCVLAFFIFASANSVLHEMMAGIILVVGVLASIFVRLGELYTPPKK